MPSKHEEELARVSAESQTQINRARASCDCARDHILSSRSAIARSLELLNRRYNRLDD